MPAATPRVVSDKWFVRVYGQEDFLRQKCRELQGWIDLSICHGVFHAGASTKENPHCHIIVSLTTTLQKQSFDIRIKGLFNVKGADYSTKVWDGRYDLESGEGAGSYLYHEGDDSPVLCSKGLTDLHIQQFKTVNAAVQVVVKKNKLKANTKLVDFALEEFRDQHWSGSNEFKLDIYKYMMRRCKDGLNHLPSDFQIKSYVEEVHLKLCPGHNFDGLIEQKFNSLWRL